MGITVFNTLIYFAGHTTSAINLSLISISFPIFVILFSRFAFGEVITANKALGILLVVAGIIFLITKGTPSLLLDFSPAVGDVWMLLAAVIFAVYSILLKYKPRELSFWAFQLSTFILGLIFLFPFYLWKTFQVHSVELTANVLLSILYVGIFASFTAFVLWNLAIEKVGPTKAGMIYYTLPLFSMTAANPF